MANLLVATLCLIGFSEKTLALNVVHTYGDPLLSAYLKEFEQQSGIETNISQIPLQDLKNRLFLVGERNLMPDAIIAPSDFIGFHHYVDFNEIEEHLVHTPLNDLVGNAGVLDGKRFGVPLFSGGQLLLFYNRRYVQHAPDNWDALIRQAQTLPKGVKLITWDFYDMYWFVSFVHAFGETITNEHNEPNLDTQAVQNALNFTWQLAEDGIVETDCNQECATKQFSDSGAAYIIDSAWRYSRYKQIFGDNLGVALLPSIKNQKMQSYYATTVATFPKTEGEVGNKSDKKRFMAFLQGAPFQQKVSTNLHKVPAQNNIKQEEKGNISPHLITIRQALDDARPIPSHQNMMYIWAAMLKGFRRYGSGVPTEAEASYLMQHIATRSIMRRKETDASK